MKEVDRNEDPAGKYFTDMPAWDCYGALVLWAAYNQLSNTNGCDTAGGWENDSACQTLKMNPNSRYPQLAADTEIWLPSELPDNSHHITNRQSCRCGSGISLPSEIRELNLRNWAASD